MTKAKVRRGACVEVAGYVGKITDYDKDKEEIWVVFALHDDVFDRTAVRKITPRCWRKHYLSGPMY